MAETIVTFQSQLSGVMETVFKAAMFEITRLVEESFLEEVTRCREQVETLKRRLKWSESRRREKDGERNAKCVDCGRTGTTGEQEPRPTGELNAEIASCYSVFLPVWSVYAHLLQFLLLSTTQLS